MKMRNRVLMLFMTLLTSTLVAQSAVASTDTYYSESQLENRFRKQEAISIVQDLNARIASALDNALLSGGNGPDFNSNINYFLDLQLDQNNMNITINDTNVTDVDDFKALWYEFAQLIGYRKQSLTNDILVDYKEEDSLRTITLHTIGISFVIFRSPSTPQEENAVIFDRIETTWVEACPGKFRVKEITQISESSFPLSPGSSIISSPLTPNAPGIYIPPPVDECHYTS